MRTCDLGLFFLSADSPKTNQPNVISTEMINRRSLRRETNVSHHSQSTSRTQALFRKSFTVAARGPRQARQYPPVPRRRGPHRRRTRGPGGRCGSHRWRRRTGRRRRLQGAPDVGNGTHRAGHPSRCPAISPLAPKTYGGAILRPAESGNSFLTEIVHRCQLFRSVKWKARLPAVRRQGRWGGTNAAAGEAMRKEVRKCLLPKHG